MPKFPGDYDLVMCKECGKKRTRNVMTTKEYKNEKGTSMCGYFCKDCV